MKTITPRCSVTKKRRLGETLLVISLTGAVCVDPRHCDDLSGFFRSADIR